MRTVLLALLLAANAWLWALGQGWLGSAPSDSGRDPNRLQQQLNPQAVRVVPAS